MLRHLAIGDAQFGDMPEGIAQVEIAALRDNMAAFLQGGLAVLRAFKAAVPEVRFLHVIERALLPEPLIFNQFHDKIPLCSDAAYSAPTILCGTYASSR